MTRPLPTALALAAALASTISAVPGPASAAVPAPDPALLDALIASCRPEKAYGVTFGADPPPISLSPLNTRFPVEILVDRLVRLPNETIVAVQVSVFQPTESESADDRMAWARGMESAVNARLAANPRFVHHETIPPLEGNEADGPETLWATSEDPRAGMGVQVGRFGVSLEITCIDRARTATGDDEQAGRVNIPRPTPPGGDLPATLSAGLCADPAAGKDLSDALQDALWRRLEMGNLGTRYRRRVSAWYGWQMVHRGLWSEREASRFGFDIVGPPVARGEAAVKANTTAGKALDAGDPAAACRAALLGLAAVKDMDAADRAAAARIAAAYQLEARKRGASLEPHI